MNETKITDINTELDDFGVDASTSKLAKSTFYVYRQSVKKFLKTNPDLLKVDDYLDFLREHVVLHYQNEGGKRKRNFIYFDSLIKYVVFKRRNTEKAEEKERYKRIIEILKETKPRQLENKEMTDYLTISQRLRVISNLKSLKHKTMAKLQMVLGVRIGSVLRLKTEAGKPLIDFKNIDGQVVGVIDFYKMKGGKFSRKYLFDIEQVKEFRLYLDFAPNPEHPFIDVSRSYAGQDFDIIVKTNYHWYWQDLKEALEICGFDSGRWSTHAFRKNSARDIHEETGDVYAVKEFLDHSDFRATEHYLKSEGLIKDKISILRKYSEKVTNNK